MHRLTPILILTLAASFWSGCVSNATLTEDLLAEANRNTASAPMGGEALLQRKVELDRAVHDLQNFHATLASLRSRGDRDGSVLFREFVEFYLELHLLPMLEGDWQSRHPEVVVLDVNARFVVAELWHLIGAPTRTAQMIEEIERRYVGRGSMIVAYPVGDQGTLSDGIAHLRAL